MNRSSLACLILLAACTSTRDNSKAVRALVESGRERKVRKLDLRVETVATKLPAQVPGYRIGVNDLLQVRVGGQAEFAHGDAFDGAPFPGRRVKRDGKLYLPLLGAVPAAGLTVLELQADLFKRMKKFQATPYVSVDILEHESQKFFVLGAVRQPGVFAVNGDTTLLEALGLAKGLLEQNDIEGAYVVRGRTLLPVSLADLLLRGDTSRNILMQHGDLVYVPIEVESKVYVLGEVRTPGTVRIPAEGLTLAGALAEAGGLDPLYADENELRIFRGSWQAPKVFILSAEDIYRFGEAISLKPGDRIHVAPSGLATWNRTLTLLLPFLTSTTAGVAATAAVGN